MIRIGQKIDDFGFDVYQGDEIREIKFSNYQGRWLVLLFYPIDFASLCTAELEECVAYYDRFADGGAQILPICIDLAAAHRVQQSDCPFINRIAFPIATETSAKLCSYFGTCSKDHEVSWRRTFIIDPNGVLRAKAIRNGTSAGARAAGELGRLAAKPQKENNRVKDSPPS